MISEFLYDIFLVFLILYLGVIIIVSMIFSIRAYQTRLKNLIYGGICFVLVVVSRVGGLLLNFNILLESIFFTLHYVFAVFFVKSIFYKDRKSPYFSIMLITIIGSVFLNSVIFLEMNQN